MGQTLVVVENKLLFWAIAFILRKRWLLTKAKQRKVKTHVRVEYFWYLCNSWLLAQPKFICAEHTVFQRFMLVSSSRIPGIFPDYLHCQLKWYQNFIFWTSVLLCQMLYSVQGDVGGILAKLGGSWNPFMIVLSLPL